MTDLPTRVLMLELSLRTLEAKLDCLRTEVGWLMQPAKPPMTAKERMKRMRVRRKLAKAAEPRKEPLSGAERTRRHRAKVREAFENALREDAIQNFKG